MIARCVPLLALGPLLTAQSLPPYELTEVLVQPLAGGHQIVELTGSNAGPTSTAGWYLVHANGATLLPTVQLPGDSIVLLHLGVNGTNTQHNLYLPAFPTLATSDAIALYSAAPQGNPAALTDFLCWGGTTGPLAAIAVQNGRWTSTLASAAVPSAPGATIANRTFTRTTSNLIGPLAWYVDTTPTLGTANDPGTTYNRGAGCGNSISFIAGVSLFDPGPWTGEVHVLPIVSVPAFPGIALLTFGFSDTGPVPLDFAGLSGCVAHATIDVQFLLQLQPNENTIFFTYLIPNSPGLAGLTYYAQAIVPNPAMPNPLQADVTNAVGMVVGSR